MADDLVLRLATVDDLPAHRAVFDAVAVEGRWIGTEAPVDWASRAASTERLVGDDPTAVLVVAEVGGVVVGSITAEHGRSGRVGLGMAIVDGHRGRGIGTALLGWVVDWARERGAHKVTLELWPDNDRALGLYRKLGFEVEGRYRRHWRRRDGSLWDAVGMGLVLDNDAPGGPPPR
ncbi:MAG: GNAT family N-acetyltransferase [Acidimicrobiia bacterium]|jgi:RimJ/RimL family protein N-acetyltransferase|nr:GNAT family N-acetyltransferase [Acidimicrobiia bacterium]